jgi:membrane-bound serine protease (ClpP class)
MHPRLAAMRRCVSVAVLALLVLGLTASLAFGDVPASTSLAAPSAQADDGDEAGDGEGAGADARDLRMIEILPLRGGFIDPPVVAQIQDVLATADDADAELIVLQYSSGGGVSVDLDELLGGIQGSQVPVAVLVGPLWNRAEAAGAAGLLWLAADVRAIAVDATVGPLAPADLAEGDDPTLRARVEQLVAAAGGDEALAERLLTEAVPAEDLVDAGVATMSATGLEPLLVELDGMSVTTAAGEQELRIRSDEIEVRLHSLGLLRRLLHAATTGPFIYLLLVVGLGLLLFEVFQPGFGVAGLAGVVTVAIGAFGLFVLPVVWWGVALVVLGLLLYAIDTAVAGFGPVTLAATAAFVAAFGG